LVVSRWFTEVCFRHSFLTLVPPRFSRDTVADIGPVFFSDISARNILLDREGDAEDSPLVAKISDFGQAGVEDGDHSGKEIAWKWAAPELCRALVDVVEPEFTTRSDVFAFGVLIYETLSFGREPWPTLSNREVVDRVLGGSRLKPSTRFMDDYFVDLQADCFVANPDDRPAFKEIEKRIRSYLVDTEGSYQGLYAGVTFGSDTTSGGAASNPASLAASTDYAMSPGLGSSSPAQLTVGNADEAYSMTPDLGASAPQLTLADSADAYSMTPGLENMTPQLTLGNSAEAYSMTPGLESMTPQLTIGNAGGDYSFSPNSDSDDSDSDADSDANNLPKDLSNDSHGSDGVDETASAALPPALG
jgi:serine/threonine protein kinase